MTGAGDIDIRTSRRVPALALAAVALAVAADFHGPIRHAAAGHEAQAAHRYVVRGDNVAGVGNQVAVSGGTIERELPVIDVVAASLDDQVAAWSNGFVSAAGSARKERLVRDDGNRLTVELREGTAIYGWVRQE